MTFNNVTFSAKANCLLTYQKYDTASDL